MKKLLFICSFCIFCSVASGQNIKGHYVSKTQEDGTVYHTFPVTLFSNSDSGDLTFDLTYKQKRGSVDMNFTYLMKQPVPIDSVKIVSGANVISGSVNKLYVEPNKNEWKHRYTLSGKLDSFCVFFDERALPELTLYADGKPYVYKVKKSAWKNYAPIGFKIFEMIRFNDNN